MLRRTSKILVGAGALGIVLGGCGNNSPLDAKNPVSIDIWTYYNGDQLTAFDALVEEFNETVGKEKGIVVKGYSQGSVNDLESNVLAAVQGEVGADEVPNIFAAYADTAYAVDQMGQVVDLKEYLNKEEIDAYIDSYIKEGDFAGTGEIKIFPTAKSTEIFVLNKTDWDKFAAAEGADYTDLKMTPHFDKETVRKLWDSYYIPFVKGYYAATGRFRSDDIKTGNIIAFIGSSSGVSFLPESVNISDTQSYPIEIEILPCPQFLGGESKYAVQQGAGMVVTKGTEAEIYASVEFLKWFTADTRNIQFSVNSGYLPVTKTANDKNAIADSGVQTSGNIGKMLSVGVDTVNGNKMYTTKAFQTGTKARNILEYAMSDRAAADREIVVSRLASGMQLEEACADFVSEENFNAWYEETLAKLQAFEN